MKKVFLLLAAVVMLHNPMFAGKPEGKQTLTVMSYNIRNGEANDGTNSWRYRCPATIYMLRDQNPDIFGVQEAYSYQVEFITENLRNYKSVGRTVSTCPSSTTKRPFPLSNGVLSGCPRLQRSLLQDGMERAAGQRPGL